MLRPVDYNECNKSEREREWGPHLYELVGVRMQLGQHGRGLVGRAVLEDALDDAAAVRVRGQCVHLPRERVDDELQRRRLHALDALLHLRHTTPNMFTLICIISVSYMYYQVY